MTRPIPSTRRCRTDKRTWSRTGARSARGCSTAVWPVRARRSAARATGGGPVEAGPSVGPVPPAAAIVPERDSGRERNTGAASLASSAMSLRPLSVFAVEDTTAQVCWRSLTGHHTVSAGRETIAIDAGDGPGAAVLEGLRPGARHLLRLDGRPVGWFRTLEPPP